MIEISSSEAMSIEFSLSRNGFWIVDDDGEGAVVFASLDDFLDDLRAALELVEEDNDQFFGLTSDRHPAATESPRSRAEPPSAPAPAPGWDGPDPGSEWTGDDETLIEDPA